MKGTIIIVWLALAGIAGFALFSISFKVQHLETELAKLNKKILEEQNAVHVLRAEWSYLNRPANIEALAHELLPDMHRPKTSQIGSLDDLDNSPPTTQANGPAAGVPITRASARSAR